MSSRAKADTLLTYDDAAIDQVAGSNLRCVQTARPRVAVQGRLRSRDVPEGPRPGRRRADARNDEREPRQRRPKARDHRRGYNQRRAHDHGARRADARAGACFCRTSHLYERFVQVEPGDDRSLPRTRVAQVVSDPLFFALATNGRRGIQNAPDADSVQRGRWAVRGRLEDASAFGKRFPAPRIACAGTASCATRRGPQLEGVIPITRLMLIAETPGAALSDYEIAAIPRRAEWSSPRFRIWNAGDNMQAQAAVAFLLRPLRDVAVAHDRLFAAQLRVPRGARRYAARIRIIRTRITSPAQNVMWARAMKITSGLISLLKASGLWARSVVYIATRFRPHEIACPAGVRQVRHGRTSRATETSWSRRS